MFKHIFFFVFILITINLYSQKESDIEGTWIPGSGKANVRIYKTGNHFYGAIIFLKEPIDSVTHKPQVDKNNPDK